MCVWEGCLETPGLPDWHKHTYITPSSTNKLGRKFACNITKQLQRACFFCAHHQYLLAWQFSGPYLPIRSFSQRTFLARECSETAATQWESKTALDISQLMHQFISKFSRFSVFHLASASYLKLLHCSFLISIHETTSMSPSQRARGINFPPSRYLSFQKERKDIKLTPPLILKAPLEAVWW